LPILSTLKHTAQCVLNPHLAHKAGSGMKKD
jgi:hypothetical protein